MDLGFIELIDWHAGAVLAITVGTFYLFAKERLPVQSTALLALLALMLLFGVFPYQRGDRPLGPEQFLAGFGNSALVTICFLMVLGHGLTTTGALEPVVRRLARLWSFTPQLAFLLILVFCVAVSGVVNDTPIVVLLMPVLIAIAARTGTSVSRTLLPMNYAVLIGGMATTIGTSTNLLVVGIAGKLGAAEFGLFDFTHIVAIAAAIALPYLWLAVPRLLPKDTGDQPRGVPLAFDAALEVREDGYAAGKPLQQLGKRARGLRPLGVQRGGARIAPLPDVELRAGDRILLQAAPDDLREFGAALGAWLHARERDEVPGAPDQTVAQALVTSEADLAGTASSARQFADQHRLAVIGIHRPGSEHPLDPEETFLRPGDVLLVRGHRDQVDGLRASAGVLMLDAMTELPHTRRAPLALAIMAGVIFIAATGILPMVLASAVGVAAMLLTGCLGWREATDALSSKVIMIVVASLALGEALTATGMIAGAGTLLAWMHAYVPAVVMLAALMLLMAVITNFVSNNAAAIIGTPVAIAMAATMGVDPRPFVLAVLFGCNLCYATPMAYQTNLLVMSAAGYRFADFVRAGLPLLAIMWITLTWLLAREYGLL
ncbi:MAG TPA: SLC13 family permease [Steroidobacteraceae bacterium]|nr:SLC13 family permease [Steroidobacteraceae bacterium]